MLNTDDPIYGGHDILKNVKPYFTHDVDEGTALSVYMPARSGLILKRTA